MAGKLYFTRRMVFEYAYLGEFVMKTLIAALAVTAILATSAIAKTRRAKEARVQPNNSYCHFHYV
jgi:hypothetical protein